GAVLALSVGLHGIGMGDNVNPNGTGNITAQPPSPQHPTHMVTVTLTDPSGNTPQQLTGQITFSGITSATVNGPILITGTNPVNSFTTGNYLVKIAIDGFLQRRIPQIVHITQGQTTQFPTVNLVNGDIVSTGASANQLDILDYNALVNCFGSKQN